MKVYSWKTWLVTVFGGGAGIAFSIYKIKHGEILGYGWLIIFLYMIINGMLAACNAEAHRKDVENGKRGEMILRRRFGRFARIAPFGGLLCFMVAAVLVRVFPDKIWLGMCFVFAAPIYQFWLTRMICREMESGDW